MIVSFEEIDEIIFSVCMRTGMTPFDAENMFHDGIDVFGVFYWSKKINEIDEKQSPNGE